VNASTSVGERTAGSSCELEEHIEEVRTRNEELSRLLTEQPFDGRVLDAIWLQVEAVRELLGRAIEMMRPEFAAAGALLPENLAVSCSWPSGNPRTVIGECWVAEANGNACGNTAAMCGRTIATQPAAAWAEHCDVVRHQGLTGPLEQPFGHLGANETLDVQFRDAHHYCHHKARGNRR
jgi:hypothetical protein